MSDEIVIEKNLLHNRLSNFLTQWKTDKRQNDALFQGAGSIVILVGKASDGAYVKSTAFQVRFLALEQVLAFVDEFQLWLLGYEFPSTLIVLTQETVHIVTTKKKGMPALGRV